MAFSSRATVRQSPMFSARLTGSWRTQQAQSAHASLPALPGDRPAHRFQYTSNLFHRYARIAEEKRSPPHNARVDLFRRGSAAGFQQRDSHRPRQPGAPAAQPKWPVAGLLTPLASQPQ